MSFLACKKTYILAGVITIMGFCPAWYLYSRDIDSNLVRVPDAYCVPAKSCTGGVLVEEDGDGCSLDIWGDCTGICKWCSGSTEQGRWCQAYEGAECGIPSPPTTIDCGDTTEHPCINGGGHGLIRCCPPATYQPSPSSGCESLSECSA